MTMRDWTIHFPGLRALEPDRAALLVKESRIVAIPEGTLIFGPGQTPENYLLLLKGSVRVQQVSETGREIVLYRVSAGESCALTTACLMGYEDYQAEGVAETATEAVAIPRATFDTLIAQSPAFRQFVFNAFSSRITNLFRLIEEVAFSRIDIRLAHKLVELGGREGRVALTHQQLASELGTAREVISRQINEFQRRGWISASRGEILISNKNGLLALSKAP